MGKILVIGSANADMVVRSPKMPALGETVIGSGSSVGAGGKGLNQAVAVKKLGGDVRFVGALGKDANGEMLGKTLDKYDIPATCLEVEDCATGCAMIVVVDGDNFIVVDEGANARLTPDVIDSVAGYIESSDILLIQYEIPVESVMRIAEICAESRAMLVVNPAPFKQLPTEFYKDCDLLVPNEHEAYALTGIYPSDAESAKAALDALLGMGVRSAIITLGERGSVYSDGEVFFECPAIKTRAVDTTSAGDSFIGALCVRLAAGERVEDAIRYATKVSAITVSRSGASDSIPFANEII